MLVGVCGRSSRRGFVVNGAMRFGAGGVGTGMSARATGVSDEAEARIVGLLFLLVLIFRVICQGRA